MRVLRIALPEVPYVVVAFVFTVARIVYRLAFGVRFDISPVRYCVQFIDPWFFEHDFARSVLYLHHQAPLPNLIVGASLRALGAHGAGVLLDTLFVTLGLTLALALTHVLLRLGVSSALATLLVCAYAASPVTVIYESLLFYHLPVAALLVLGLAALLRYYESGTFGAAFLFCGILGAVALTRSVFGVLWIVAIVAPLLVRPPRAAAPGVSPRAVLTKAVAIPLILVSLNGAKTRWLVGHEYGSALLWCNLAIKVFYQVPPAEREGLIARGVLTEAATVEPFSDLSHYAPLRVPHPPTGIPLLDLDSVPSGLRNAHSIEYALIGERCCKPDALYLLRHYPQAYAESVWVAFRDSYFLSASEDATVERGSNYRRLKNLEVLLRRLGGRTENGSLLWLVVGLPLATMYGVTRLLRDAKGPAPGGPIFAACAYMLVTIAYVTAGTTLVSYGDFNRYRFEIDPLYLVLGALLAQDVGRRALRRFSRGGRWPPGVCTRCGRRMSAAGAG